MSYNVQQEDLQLLRQPIQNNYIKIELLNPNFKTVGELEGEIQYDDYTFDASADIRGAYKAIFVVNDSTFNIGRDKKIWFDKYLRISLGIFHIASDKIRWYPIGLFIFNNADYSYNTTTRTLTLSCLDRVAELTGERKGQLSGLMTVIPADNDIRSAMISTITQLGGIKKYRIEDIKETVPYDLEFNTGSHVWDIVVKLRDLYPGWESFFDDEMFIHQPYPTYISDPVVLDAETIAPLVVSEDTSIKLGDMKNVTEVWGRCLDADYYTVTSSMSGNQYNLVYGNVSTLSRGAKFGFKANANNMADPYVKVDNFTAYPLLGENNVSLPAGKIEAGKSYVIKYVNGYFYYMGEHQIIAIAKLVSKYPDVEKIEFDKLNEPTTNITYIVQPDSPFCSDFEDVGEVRQVFSGGEYDNIYSESLATQRAEYENWRSTDLLDNINISMVDVPWVNVNQKIEYTSQATGATGTYLIRSKMGSTMKRVMTLSCSRFQPLYPWNL